MSHEAMDATVRSRCRVLVAADRDVLGTQPRPDFIGHATGASPLRVARPQPAPE